MLNKGLTISMVIPLSSDYNEIFSHLLDEYVFWCGELILAYPFFRVTEFADNASC